MTGAVLLALLTGGLDGRQGPARGAPPAPAFEGGAEGDVEGLSVPLYIGVLPGDSSLVLIIRAQDNTIYYHSVPLTYEEGEAGTNAVWLFDPEEHPLQSAKTELSPDREFPGSGSGDEMEMPVEHSPSAGGLPNEPVISPWAVSDDEECGTNGGCMALYEGELPSVPFALVRFEGSDDLVLTVALQGDTLFYYRLPLETDVEEAEFWGYRPGGGLRFATGLQSGESAALSRRKVR